MSTTDTQSNGEPQREPRTFLFGDDDTGTPEVVLLDEYTNRYGDTRVVIETPAPWDTPDGMTPANELVKALEWDDHHWSFEEEHRLSGHENVWIVDDSGLEPITESATAAGYEVVDHRDTPHGGYTQHPDLAALCSFVEEGDRVVVRYVSKQSGNEMEKEGTVTDAQAAETPDLTTGLVFRRPDGGTNYVKEGDRGEPGVFSNSRYPFMGEPVSVEVWPGDGDEEYLL